MKAVVENRYIRALGNAIPREAHFYLPRPPRGQRMDLRCPKCNGSDLKKVSLAYQEGLSRLTAKSRLRGLLFGEDGPNVVVGTAVTNGTYQTELSKRLSAPKKWSYGRLLLGAALVALASLIFYVHVVMVSTSKSSSMRVLLFGVVGMGVLVAFMFLTWRHNHLIYPRRYEEWNSSFVCLRCGAVSIQPTSESAT